jgi:hypothetical protein
MSPLFAASLHSNAVGILALMVIVLAIGACAAIAKHMWGDNPRGAIGVIGVVALGLLVATATGRALLLGGATKIINAIVG